MLLAKEGSVAKSAQLLLCLTHQSVEPSFHIWQFLSNVVHQHLLSDFFTTNRRT